MMEEKEDQVIKRFKFFINGKEINYTHLAYRSRGLGHNVNGFEIEVRSEAIDYVGNVEFVKLASQGHIVAMNWAIVQRDHMHYWKFSEVVSYSPWWSGVEKWAESMQGE
jgi:hypothetical protein